MFSFSKLYNRQFVSKGNLKFADICRARSWNNIARMKLLELNYMLLLRDGKWSTDELRSDLRFKVS